MLENLGSLSRTRRSTSSRFTFSLRARNLCTLFQHIALTPYPLCLFLCFYLFLLYLIRFVLYFCDLPLCSHEFPVSHYFSLYNVFPSFVLLAPLFVPPFYFLCHLVISRLAVFLLQLSVPLLFLSLLFKVILLPWYFPQFAPLILPVLP